MLHVKKKKKQVRGNQMSFFNKGILKEIMTRAKLHNIFLQNKSEENRKFKKQRNFRLSFKKGHKEIFRNFK